MVRGAAKWLIVINFALGLNVASWAQDSDVGKLEYQSGCASCHGSDAKGHGPVSGQLKQAPPDLTILAKKNNGVFPRNFVFETIYGLKVVIAHGTRDMPIWGYRFAPSLNSALSPNASEKFTNRSYDPDAVVEARILAVIDYLNSIQEK
jgi:mono/diheme cytochrome c family protein